LKIPNSLVNKKVFFAKQKVCFTKQKNRVLFAKHNKTLSFVRVQNPEEGTEGNGAEMAV
jgi:hypothetical protein